MVIVMGEYQSRLARIVWPENETEQWEALKNSEQLAQFRAYRERIREHKFTPHYHFCSPDGLLNDPNGLCCYKGYYHLFYQQYPSVDPRQHWGHAISDDMVHWRDLPTAIYPDPEKHVFSGNAVVEEDRVLAMYHGTMRGNMVAQSRDPLLLNWEKITGDAVIPIKEGLPYGIYDPFLRREEDGYYALSGTKVWTPYGHRMAEEQFYSKDLIHWVWLGDLLEENPYLAVNEDGACPYFIPMKDDRYLLFHFSHTSGPHILSGIYNRETHKFRPDAHLKLSSEIPGRGSLNAPCVMSDGSGGGYCIFNCTDGRDTDSESPRSGMMTMMYHVTLDEKNAPVISPLAQYDSLHKELLCDGSFAAKHGERILLPARGRALDIQLTMDLSRSIGFELEVFAGEREKTVIRFVEQNSSHEPRRAYVMVDAGRSSLDPLQYGNVPETADVPVMGDERQLDIRILTDACTVEVFCQGRVVFSTAYPTLPDSDGVFLTGIGGTAVCRNAKIWSMEQIY